MGGQSQPAGTDRGLETLAVGQRTTDAQVDAAAFGLAAVALKVVVNLNRNGAPRIANPTPTFRQPSTNGSGRCHCS